MKYILIFSIIILLSNDANSQAKDTTNHISVGWVKQHTPSFFLKVNDSTVVSQVGDVYLKRGKRYYWRFNCKN
jgi:hypothetical protein